MYLYHFSHSFHNSVKQLSNLWSMTYSALFKRFRRSLNVLQVIKQTKSRFTPDVNFIKKNIESLIEKLYIQRTDQNDEYQYLA